jgi:hypothetical protein
VNSCPLDDGSLVEDPRPRKSPALRLNLEAFKPCLGLMLFESGADPVLQIQ